MRKTTLGLGALALGLGIVGASTGIVFAYQGDATVKNPQYSPERHEAIEKAFETNDYEAWKNLMQGRGRVSEVITKDNFARFAEVHKFMEEGKKEEAQRIAQELGLGAHNGQGQGQKQGHRNGMRGMGRTAR